VGWAPRRGAVTLAGVSLCTEFPLFSWGRYTAGITAAQEIVGPVNGSERLRMEVRGFAIAGIMHDRAAQTWAELVAQREHGRGKRLNLRQVERAARRVGLAAITLKDATERLEVLAAKTRRPPTLAEYLADDSTGG
jgi:hypothetical protein